MTGIIFRILGIKSVLPLELLGGVLVLAGFAAGIWWHRRKTKKGQETEKWKVGRGPCESFAAAKTGIKAADIATSPSAVVGRES